MRAPWSLCLRPRVCRPRWEQAVPALPSEVQTRSPSRPAAGPLPPPAPLEPRPAASLALATLGSAPQTPLWASPAPPLRPSPMVNSLSLPLTHTAQHSPRLTVGPRFPADGLGFSPSSLSLVESQASRSNSRSAKPPLRPHVASSCLPGPWGSPSLYLSRGLDGPQLALR